ncbi:MAG TPA: hypothetical protein VE177_01280 [Candidatus Binatus sp.]|nr:hypothetical protein [Candidatus Binatus sp.]
MREQDRRSGFELAKLFAVLGGLFTLFSGILVLTSPLTSPSRLSSLDWVVNVATYGFLVVILGLVAVLASKHVSSLSWAVAIIGVGLLAYRFGASYLYDLGPIMIVFAGIVALVVKLV